jgi:HlyD family secretion protein
MPDAPSCLPPFCTRLTEFTMTTKATTRDPLSSADMEALLNEPVHATWWKRPLVWGSLVVLLVGGGGYYYWQKNAQAKAAPAYITSAVGKGNLTLSVAANGTLQPTRSVSIGSELSGTVRKVYVDVNDRVQKGQVLVELDTAKLSDQVARSRATLAAANAKVTQANATLTEAKGNLARLEEVSRLSGGKVPSGAELDSGRATVARAVADQLVAQANVAEATATASTDATNLSKGSIRSPIDGVVLTRTVDPGNAVAASLQAVTLFTVAEDLKELRLQVNVDEADVGAVKVGQKASFTVSAYPARKYPATITRVAFGSTITENVVTYVTYLDVDNSDLSLRPGMTAAATITATERKDVLLVPSPALRFQPAASAKAGDQSEGGIVSSLLPRFPSGKKKASGSGTAKQVWVLQDGAATAISVTAGINDGRMTEITGGDLREGMLVITDQRSVSKP